MASFYSDESLVNTQKRKKEEWSKKLKNSPFVLLLVYFWLFVLISFDRIFFLSPLAIHQISPSMWAPIPPLCAFSIPQRWCHWGYVGGLAMPLPLVILSPTQPWAAWQLCSGSASVPVLWWCSPASSFCCSRRLRWSSHQRGPDPHLLGLDRPGP